VIAEARNLLLEYGRFVISHQEAARFCFGSLEKEAARLPASYKEQGGGCLVAFIAAKPAGFVAWRRAPGDLAKTSWEIKRLWVCPEGRGYGLGRALMQAALDRAAQAGRNAVYLDTIPSAMQDALKLYHSMGFTPCAPYNDNPVEQIAYFVKNL
jgi:GNAT superfamily N-acetyltransferase